jgi:DNA repair protein RecO
MLGIVLSKRDYRENDEIITFFTDKKGKKELLTKGSKKITSKNSYLLEPAVLVDFQYVSGKAWDRVTNVDEVEYFPKLRTNLKKGLIADYSVKLVARLTESEQSDENIFHLLLTWLYFLKKNVFKPVYIDAFVVQLLAEIGFKPTIRDKEEIDGFSIKEGRFSSRDSNSDQYFFSADKEDAERMKQIIQFEFTKPKDLGYDLKLHKLIFSFGDYHLENELSDWRNVIVRD